MFKQHATVFNLTVLLILLIACNSGNLLYPETPPTPTPTFVLAQYTTPTPTLPPTAVVEPAASATKLPQSRPTATPKAPTAPPAGAADETPTPTASPSPAATLVVTTTAVVATTSVVTATAVAAATPTQTIMPTPAALSGRIAFPVDDGGGYYDVWVVELPDGEPFLVQARASQPSFSKDGRLLVKMAGSDLGESIGLLDAAYSWQGILNESPEDSYPFWHPDGTRYTYSNSNLVKDPDTAHLAPHIFSTCSIQIPRFENSEKCQDIRRWGTMVIGEAPVWTDDDRIAFFSYKGDDGVYFVESASLLREAGGVGPKQLLVRSNGRPTDTAGAQLFFSAGDIDGNWEAYAIDLDGTNLTNLSNAPLSQDGLPAISPDGGWVAFVSDRDGPWGVWATPLAGGEPVKLVDISRINTNPSPWGEGNRAWMMERISWGP